MAEIILSMKQVTEQLGISQRTVYRLMDEDKLHPFKMGKSWRFDQSDINAYIDDLRMESKVKRGRKRGTSEAKEGEPAA